MFLYISNNSCCLPFLPLWMHFNFNVGHHIYINFSFFLHLTLLVKMLKVMVGDNYFNRLVWCLGLWRKLHRPTLNMQTFFFWRIMLLSRTGARFIFVCGNPLSLKPVQEANWEHPPFFSLYDLANVVPTLAKFYHQASEAYEQACTRYITMIIYYVSMPTFVRVVIMDCLICTVKTTVHFQS